MLKLLTALLRGRLYRSAEAAADANALTILDQQIRDAACDLAAAKRTLALSMAQAGNEERRLHSAQAQIADLEQRALAALAGGRADLANEAAATIAEMENDAAAAKAAQAEFLEANAALRAKVERAERRLGELQRGRRTAHAAEAVRRLRVGPAWESGGALCAAESTLGRLREKQSDAAQAEAAGEWLESRRSPPALAARLEAEGFGPSTRATAEGVLNRLRERRREMFIDRDAS